MAMFERSAWTWETSGSGGVSFDFVAASGGVVKLHDPGFARDPRRPSEVFHYGAVGVGLSTPGVKIPKVGSSAATGIARWVAGHAVNGGFSLPSMRNEAVIYRTMAVGPRELTRLDFTGVCFLLEIGVSTPIIGLTGFMFLTGMTVETLAALSTPAVMAVEHLLGRDSQIAPKAVILGDGDTRGLSAGITGYVGYMR